MEKENDVDKVLLDLARTMLPRVQLHGHPGVIADSVDDIPWLVVLVFELLTSDPMPARYKQFGSLEEQARTLQTVIDSLEKALSLPMSHVTGRGVAKLDRQQTRDLLEILVGLVDHCFPQQRNRPCHGRNDRRATGTQNRNACNYKGKVSPDVSPIGRRLTISQLATPECENRAFCTPPLHDQGNSVLPIGDIGRPLVVTQTKPQSVQEPWMPRAPAVNRNPATHSGVHMTEHIPDYIEMAPCPRATNTVTPDESSLISASSSALQSVSGSVAITTLAERDTKTHEYKQARGHCMSKHLSTNSQSAGTCRLENLDQCRRPAAYADKDMKQLIEGKSSGRVFSKQPSAMLMLSPKRNCRSEKGRARVFSPIVHLKDTRKPSITDKYASRFSPYSNNTANRRQGNSNYEYTSPFAKNENIGKPAMTRKPSIKSFQHVKSTAQKTEISRDRSNRMKIVSLSSSSVRHGRFGHDKEHRASKKNDVRTPVLGVHTELNRDAVNPPRDRILSKSNSRSRKTSARLYPSTKSIAEKKKQESVIRRPSTRSILNSPPKHRKSRRQSSRNVMRKLSSRQGCSPVVVVSTKARKRSTCGHASPTFKKHRELPVKRGDVSPQTSSLCSSLRLLHEFDYVKRRLEQIQRLKREHEAAIRELEHEEIRLNYLVSHVHFQAEKLSSDLPPSVPVN